MFLCSRQILENVMYVYNFTDFLLRFCCYIWLIFFTHMSNFINITFFKMFWVCALRRKLWIKVLFLIYSFFLYLIFFFYLTLTEKNCRCNYKKQLRRSVTMRTSSSRSEIADFYISKKGSIFQSIACQETFHLNVWYSDKVCLRCVTWICLFSIWPVVQLHLSVISVIFFGY